MKYRVFVVLCLDKIHDILLKLSLMPTPKTLRSETKSGLEVNTKKVLKKVLTKIKRHVNIKFLADEAKEMDFEK